MMRPLLYFASLAAIALISTAAFAEPDDPHRPEVDQPPALLPQLDPSLPRYIPLTGRVKGTIRIAGSELLDRLLRRWSADFQAIYPNVKVEVETLPTPEVFPKLLSQEADVVAMIREPNLEEAKAFLLTIGQDPTPIFFGGDMHAVIVNHQNPITGLTMNQLAAIYGRFPEEQAAQDLTHWTQLGVQKPASSSPIHLYGPDEGTEEEADFCVQVLKDLPRKENVARLPDSAAVVRAVAADPLGIGYVSSSQSMAGVRVVPLAKQEVFFEPKSENFGRRYPWNRMLYLTLPIRLTDPVKDRADPLVAQFIRFIYSQEGQSGLVREGFAPLPEKLAEHGRFAVCPRP